MLRWLPGADDSTRDMGKRLVQRAVELYETAVGDSERRKVTIAIGEIGELLLGVVFHVNQKSAERIAAKLRKLGVSATATSGDRHAETALYQNEPKVRAIGISNANGPCPACKKFFGESSDGFANVYWDDDAWIHS